MFLMTISSYTTSTFSADHIYRHLSQREQSYWHNQTRFPQFINYFYKLVKYSIRDIQSLLSSLPNNTADLFMPPNPHKDDIALVRYTKKQDDICNQELEFLNKRKKYVQKGIEKFLGTTVQNNQIPRIALCFSGGGFRSMLMTLGFLQGAEDIGLLDASTYMASLSGSTWAIAPWIASGKSLQQFRAGLVNHIKFGLNHIDDVEELRMLFSNLLAKVHNEQCISAMDIYGAILANTLLNDLEVNRLSLTLSESHKNVIQGALPLPIYTALQTNPNPYEWMEVTPFEVGSSFLNSYVATWAYGRKFVNDVSVDRKSEQTLGYYLGIFGSAFEVNFEDLLHRTTFNLAKIKDSLPSFLGDVVDKVISTILYSPLNNFRLFPSMLSNFTYKSSYSPLRDDNTICLVDAGIDCNLPLPPLLRKQRNVDIIIIYDASGIIEGAPELRRIVEYAKTKGIALPPIDFDTVDKNTISVFKDENSTDTPIIVYFPRIKNPAFCPEFDPTFCVENEYCNTFNFMYSQTQIKTLCGLAEFTLKQHADILRNVIKGVIEHKKTM